MEEIRQRPPGIWASLWLRPEALLNRFVGQEMNPLYYLGAIGIFFIWTILISGFYLFIFYNITAKGAYHSIEYLTRDQWYLGGVMRSLHRYASDGLVIVMTLHALQTLMKGRFRHWRRVAWVTGIACAWIVWLGGIFGYWLVWDEKARLVAVLSARMLESLPVLAQPLSLSFTRPENVTDQLFYIVLFIHFAAIVVVYLLLMIHLSKITKAQVTPPRAMGYGILAALLVISLIKPAVSAPAVELKKLPVEVPFDWFYLFVYPLLKTFTAPQAWLFIVSLTLMAAFVPWFSRAKRQEASVVANENCVGCELCLEDCPYVAIRMRPRTDAMPFATEAVVVPSRCASCGICVGACDYNAINLPYMIEDDLKTRIRGLSKELVKRADRPAVFVFACAKGPLVADRLKDAKWAEVLTVPCVGMVQHSWLPMPMEEGVSGVVVAGCRANDCEYRRGNEWFDGRLAGVHPPVVRRAVDKTRIRALHLSSMEGPAALREIEAFRQELERRHS